MLPYEQLPPPRDTERFTQLQGVRVIDLSTSIAGPYATQLLGDFGASVLKVEKTGTGDDARQWGPPFLNGASLWFLSVNRNKHSLALDVGSPEGRGIFLELLREADVLVLNMTAGVQKKLGLDYETLHAKFSRLIHASLTGFGLTGKRADLPCYDLVAEGYSGIMDLTGEPDREAQKVGTPAADLLAGQDLAMAVLAALYARQRHGCGCNIDISMLAAMARFTAPRLVTYLGSGELPRRAGGKDSVIAIYQVFDTADAPMSLGLGNDAIWRRFWEAVGDVAFGSNPEFASNSLRREQRTRIVARIGEILRSRPRDAWLELFAQQRVPAGPINRVDEIAGDALLREQGFLYTCDSAYGPIPQVGLGIAVDGKANAHGKPPPALGEDTIEVLSGWLGKTSDEIESLRQRGVV
jgi:crotonobetainyl-CoA:carnitine CoA-transferase CaiB-like acyl-CoA transferase